MGLRTDRIARWSALLLTAAIVVFGAVTLVRSTSQNVRKTDLTVFLRAAWAVQQGEDIYQVTDEHGWHYHYPPLLAAALTPLAQPPADVDAKPLIPFGTVVVIWYLAGVALVAASSPWLAARIGCDAVHRNGRYRRWILHAPIWVLLVTLGSSLGRGQVNELVLILLTGMVVAAVSGSRGLAGVFLAGAACIKVIPIYLAVYPLWKRDWRWLSGTAVGLVIGLVVVPAAIVGPARTWQLNGEWVRQIMQPAFSDGAASDRGGELLSMIGTDNNSFQGVIHGIRHLDRTTRPGTADFSTQVTHLFLAAVFTIITLVAGSRSNLKEPQREALVITGLFVPMLLSSPVCHLHYFVLLMPLIVALIAAHLVNGQRVRPALAGTLVVVFFTQLLPRLPGLEIARDVGIAALGAVLLWMAAIIELSGEGKLKIRLPGYRKAMRLYRGYKTVTIHEPGSRPKTTSPSRRLAS